MPRQTAFVKVSGDVSTLPSFIDAIATLSNTYFVVVCVGGGTQIKKAFVDAGFVSDAYGPLGRETNSFEERQLARDILEKNQAKLQDTLADKRITASVTIPVIDIGTVLCHVNGDQMVKTAYLGFDRIFIATLEERSDKKNDEFADLPKIEILSF